MRWRPYFGSGRPPIAEVVAGETSWRPFLVVLAVLAAAGLAVVSWLAYMAAAETPASKSVPLGRLTVLGFVAGFAVAGFMAALRKAFLEDPLLDVLLVAPLGERRIFWRVWREVLGSGALGLLLCGPLWGWLLGRRAEPWLYPAVAAVLVLGIVVCAALAAVLSHLKVWISLPLIAAGMVGIPALGVFGTLGRGAEKLGPDGWHPVASAIVALAVLAAALLAAADALARLTFTHERLARIRSQPPRKLKEAVPRPPRLARRLVRGLGRRRHAYWRLVHGDEHPESLVRYVPVVLAAYGLAVLVIFASRRSLGSEFPLPLFLIFPGLLSLHLFTAPSTFRLFLRGHAGMIRKLTEKRAETGLTRPVFHEIFPVPVGAWVGSYFLNVAGLCTLMLLLATPFALVVAGELWLRLGALLWLGGLMLPGLTVHGSIPRYDPRRDPLSARAYLALAIALAAVVAGLWVEVEWWNRADRYVRFAAEVRDVMDPFLSSFGSYLAVLLLAALAACEIWSVKWLLRRHRERRFDVLP